MAEGGWRKRGLLFRPEGQGGWLNSHAQVPTALLMEDRIRVFIASRPTAGLSLTGWVDLERTRPERVLAVSEAPILQPGDRGSFDEHGIMPASVVTEGDEVRLYYSGWCRLAGGAPYHNSTGLAVSNDGGHTFRRACPGPVLDRGPWEPLSATSPCVLRHNGSWHAFYSSGVAWLQVDGKPEHVYDLHHATSADGIEWRRYHKPAVLQAFPEEALTRPTVIREADGGWAMWFCHRGSKGFRVGGDTYRIGFARSADLWSWDRLDAKAGIATSAEGWDSEMIAYPCVLEADGRRLLFYNGNGFGRDGFGWAEWEE
jgi:sucrose-6-phosphate hydrolase SacC (GH32 family)